MDQNTVTIMAALIGVIGGGVFTITAVFLSRGRKIVSYDIKSMTLLRFKPLGGLLRISVDKSTLSGDSSDKDTFVEINNAYGFQITFLNVGNEDIEKPNLEIRLDKAAKIVSYELVPTSRPGYDVAAQKDTNQLNTLRVLVPFINKKEKLMLRIISTGNISKKCTVNVLGLGIKCKKRMNEKGLIIAAIGVAVSLLMLVIAIGAPNSWWVPLGGIKIQRPDSTEIPPVWYLVILIGIYATAISALGIRSIKPLWQRYFKKESEWGETETTN